jgi:hypothetical protein
MKLLMPFPILPVFIAFMHHAQMLSPLSSLLVLLGVAHAQFGISNQMMPTLTLFSLLNHQSVHVLSPLI